jgi:hypothetical protein
MYGNATLPFMSWAVHDVPVGHSLLSLGSHACVPDCAPMGQVDAGPVGGSHFIAET